MSTAKPTQVAFNSTVAGTLALVSFVVVIALDDTELGNGLRIDIVGEKTEASGGSHELVLILTCWFANYPQAFSAMFHGDFMIVEKPLFDNGRAVPTGVGKLLAVDFKEKTQGVFVNIHGDIDNIIEVDFLCSMCNLHNSFSFSVDS